MSIEEVQQLCGCKIVCLREHPDGCFTQNKQYIINSVRHRDVPGGGYIGVRIRDDKRQRKDFNFIPTSKNFIWHFFKLVSE